METSEILKRVRQIEIKTRGLSANIFAGEYHTAFKGRGMMFSEVREYQYGDDIRNIDWNVTARFNQPFIKIFEEEREMTVMLLIDVSGSREFGTTWRFKKNVITEIAAVLAFSAIQNNDKAGVIFFSDKIEKFIPPKKGKTHILHIIRELISFTPDNRNTNISEVLRYLTNAIKKRCTAFVISDFLDDNFEDALKIANQKHDVVALKIFDPRETEMPDIGFVQFKNAETGGYQWINTSSKKSRETYKKWWLENDTKTLTTFRRAGVDNVSIRTDDDYVKSLMELFRKRS